MDERISDLTEFGSDLYAAHIINLTIKAGIKHLNNSIVKLRKFVIKIRNSQVLLNDLKSIYRIKNKKFLMPIQDVDIRWNAMYLIIEKQIVMQDVMEILVNSHEDILKNIYPTSSEWSKIMYIYSNYIAFLYL